MTAVKPPVAGVIGWPVAHSRSPLIHRFWLGKLGLDGDYSRFPVHPERLTAAIHALPDLGLRGVNVTVPHKETVVAAVDHVAPSAEAVGAVNTVVVGPDGSLQGHNTDVDGVAEALSGCELAGARVALIGAGGAARAAMQVLHAAGAADVALLARTASRAEALLGRFQQAARVWSFDDTVRALADRTVVINASPMGMTGQPEMPQAILDGLGAAAAKALVFDMVYAPLDTALLTAARRNGHDAVDGLTMLIGQAATAFALFYGVAPPRDTDNELRKLLTA